MCMFGVLHLQVQKVRAAETLQKHLQAPSVTTEMSFPFCIAAAACVVCGACRFTVRHIELEKFNSFVHYYCIFTAI